MANATALQLASTTSQPRRRGRFSTLLATASMGSWVVLGAMPIAAIILALT